MSDLISYQLEDGIATLTLSNGKVNAISPDVIAAFNAALDRAEQDRAIVIITGQPGILSGGYDLKVMTSGPQNAVNLVAAGSTLARRMLAGEVRSAPAEARPRIIEAHAALVGAAWARYLPAFLRPAAATEKKSGRAGGEDIAAPTGQRPAAAPREAAEGAGRRGTAQAPAAHDVGSDLAHRGRQGDLRAHLLLPAEVDEGATGHVRP